MICIGLRNQTLGKIPVKPDYQLIHEMMNSTICLKEIL